MSDLSLVPAFTLLKMGMLMKDRAYCTPPDFRIHTRSAVMLLLRAGTVGCRLSPKSVLPAIPLHDLLVARHAGVPVKMCIESLYFSSSFSSTYC